MVHLAQETSRPSPSVLPRSQNCEAKLAVVTGERCGNVRGEEHRGNLRDHGASVPEGETEDGDVKSPLQRKRRGRRSVERGRGLKHEGLSYVEVGGLRTPPLQERKVPPHSKKDGGVKPPLPKPERGRDDQARWMPQVGQEQPEARVISVEAQNGQTVSEAGGMVASRSLSEGSLGVRRR